MATDSPTTTTTATGRIDFGKKVADAIQKHLGGTVFEDSTFSTETAVVHSASGETYHLREDGKRCDCPAEGVCSHTLYYLYLEQVVGDPVDVTDDADDRRVTDTSDDHDYESAVQTATMATRLGSD